MHSHSSIRHQRHLLLAGKARELDAADVFPIGNVAGVVFTAMMSSA
ncbi:MAG: hypothetical protein ACRDRR_05685 [Pseudonocardiaceae bacterium]